MAIKEYFKDQTLWSLMKILNTSSTQPPRLVGGCVRDALLNQKSNDIDIATCLTPTQVIQCLNDHDIKSIPTGIDHGTVTAIYNDKCFEITTLRKDVSTDGRRAIVEFTNDFELDAARRDFTINAISYDLLNDQLYDYFGGQEDLQKGIVKFIGSAQERIQEDYLRILRFYRFSARYAKEVDMPTHEICRHFSNKLTILSKERIRDELSKIFICKESRHVVKLMAEGEILTPILQLKPSINMVGRIEEENIYFLPLVMSMIFYEATSENLSNLLKDLRFSNIFIRNTIYIHNLVFGAEFTPNDVSFEENNNKIIASSNYLSHRFYILKKCCLENFALLRMVICFFECLTLSDEQSKIFEQEKSFIDNLNRESLTLPVNGNDLQNLGFSGKSIKTKLEKAKDLWIQSNFSLNKAELLKCI